MSEMNIPDSWATPTLGDITDRISYGATASASKGGKYKFLRITDLTDEGVDWDSVPFCSLSGGEKFTLKSGDIVIARTGGTVGKSYRIDEAPENAIFASYLIKVAFPKLLRDVRYLSYFFKSEEYWRHIREKAQGAAQPNVNATKLSEIPIPLPPILEQERIVNKIETCFEKIEVIEANFNKVELLLEKFRESILAKAFRGELVPHDPTDEPAKILIERIKRDRLQRANGRTVKLEVDPVGDSEKPFDLPGNWVWARFGEIAYIDSPLVNPSDYLDARHVAPNNIESGTGQLIEIKTIREDKMTSNKYLFSKGDILYSKIRPYLNKVAIAEFDGLCSADMYPIKTYIDTNYLFIFMLSKLFVSAATKSNERVLLPKINREELNRILVPVPPLNEQRQISACILDSLKFFNEKKNFLNSLKGLSSMLRQSILKKGFEGRLVKQIKAEGTGHELLARLATENSKQRVTVTTGARESLSKQGSTKNKGKRNGKK